jgi:hypothetical protein
MYFLEVLLIVFTIITILVYLKFRTRSSESFANAVLGKPHLWWIVDSEVNSRHWWDFGARNSPTPNKGYLKVALQCLEKTQSDFTIHVLLGRKAVREVLESSGVRMPENVDSMPIAIWRQWAIANLLATKGGLAMMGDSTLCIGPSFYPHVSSIDAATFGIYPNEASALPGSEHVGPAPWVGWAKQSAHPGWMYAAEKWNAIAAAGPTAWTAADARRENLMIWNEQAQKGVRVLQEVEASRNPDGSERTLEDLFERDSKPQDPKTIIAPDTVYIAFDGDALARMYRYAWFIRMSSDQILESSFIWATLAKSVLIFQ